MSKHNDEIVKRFRERQREAIDRREKERMERDRDYQPTQEQANERR